MEGNLSTREEDNYPLSEGSEETSGNEHMLRERPSCKIKT